MKDSAKGHSTDCGFRLYGCESNCDCGYAASTRKPTYDMTRSAVVSCDPTNDDLMLSLQKMNLATREIEVGYLLYIAPGSLGSNAFRELVRRWMEGKDVESTDPDLANLLKGYEFIQNARKR